MLTLATDNRRRCVKHNRGFIIIFNTKRKHIFLRFIISARLWSCVCVGTRALRLRQWLVRLDFDFENYARWFCNVMEYIPYADAGAVAFTIADWGKKNRNAKCGMICCTKHQHDNHFHTFQIEMDFSLVNGADRVRSLVVALFEGFLWIPCSHYCMV